MVLLTWTLLYKFLFLLIKCTLISKILLLSLLISTQLAEASPSVSELIQQSNKLNLFEENYWHLLMHYQPNKIGTGVTSAVDDQDFFLAPNGKENPKNELNATIKHLFAKDSIDTPSSENKCAFIARYHWLESRLSTNTELSCPEYNDWLAKINPESVSFIFSSAYMNNPTSMFGHTFLRFNKKGKKKYPLLTAATVDYVADVTNQRGFLAILIGSMGGFKGYYSIVPYHVKVKTYNDIDNRDIWEYQLNLTESQINNMLMHVWELQGIGFDYFFFTENCSYNILKLLEIAYPDLNLTDNRGKPWIAPIDMLQLLMKSPGLVAAVSNRPSTYTQIKRKQATLTKGEKHFLKKIIHIPETINSHEFDALPENKKALILDIASDYIKYQGMTNWSRESNDLSLWHKLLNKRVHLNYESDEIEIKPLTKKPDEGHKTSKFGIGMGWRDDEYFEELTFRAGYHDLLDPTSGYPLDSQVEILAFSLRHYQENNRVRLERFTLIDFTSLTPYDPLFIKPSWKLKAAMESIEFNKCDQCYNFTLNAGIGSALESHLLRREVYFIFSEMDIDFSNAFERNHRLGGGITTGVVADITSRWKILASGTYLGYIAGDVSEDIKMSLQQQFTLNKNTALRLNFNYHNNDPELLLNLNVYF